MTGSSFCIGFNEYIKNHNATKIKTFDDLVNNPNKIYSLTYYQERCSWTLDDFINKNQSKKDEFEEKIVSKFQDADVNIIAYPTVKKLQKMLGDDNALNAPGSSLGSVIGYPSITVPLGTINEYSYGIEFLTTKNNEEYLYQVAHSFEKNNNLELVNSNLTPSLYEIPEEVKTLKNTYEKYYNNILYKDIIKKTKEYFKTYSKNDINENIGKSLELIEEYNKPTIRKIVNEYDQSYFIYISFTILGIVVLIMIFKLKK